MESLEREMRVVFSDTAQDVSCCLVSVLVPYIVKKEKENNVNSNFEFLEFGSTRIERLGSRLL